MSTEGVLSSMSTQHCIFFRHRLHTSCTCCDTSMHDAQSAYISIHMYAVSLHKVFNLTHVTYMMTLLQCNWCDWLPNLGTWRFYTALHFHQSNCRLHISCTCRYMCLHDAHLQASSYMPMHQAVILTHVTHVMTLLQCKCCDWLVSAYDVCCTGF